MTRENTQELDLRSDIVWEKPPRIPSPIHVAAQSDRAANRTVVFSPPPPPRPAPALSDAQKQLLKLLDFIRWEQVAMHRFGVIPPSSGQTPNDPLALVARRMRLTSRTAVTVEYLKRTFSEVLAEMARNRQSLDEAVLALDAVLAAEARPAPLEITLDD